MISIQDLSQHVGTTVSGQFRLGGCRDRHKSDGRQYHVLQLDDATGAIKGMVWPGASQTGLLVPNSPCAVEAQVRPRWFNGELIVDVQSLRRLESDEVEMGARLLPWRLCPEIARPALRDLVEFQAAIEHPQLREFLSHVLLDQEIAADFLRSRASRRHHHAFEGGLLVHSVAPLALVKTMAEDLFYESTDDIEVTQVGYLLHDIGKVRTLNDDYQPIAAAHLRHEFFTGQLLGQHLDWLARRWPEGARGLRYILDYIDQPREMRKRAAFAGADVVVWVDQHNASLAAGRGLEAVAPSRSVAEPTSQVRRERHASR